MKKNVFIGLTLIFLGLLNNAMAQAKYSGFVQSIDIRDYQGKKFTFSTLTKYESSNQMIGFAACYDDQGRFLENHLGDEPAPMDDNAWRALTLSGKIHKKGIKLLIGVLCQDAGEYYLDNLQLTIKGDKNDAPILVNGTFEDLDSGLSAFMCLSKEDSTALVKEPNHENNHILKLTVNGESTAIGRNNKVGKQVKVNGINLYYETYGEGEPLLLLHGADMSIGSFSSIIPTLAKHYKVIALDTRGHGKSTEDGRKLTYELYAEDVNAFLDKLGIEAVNVLGWSDGGNTGLVLAMNYPDKVSRLATMAAILYNDKTSVDTKINKLLEKQIEDLESRTLNEREEFSLRVKKSLQSEPNISPAALSKINCPTLIMAGEHDYVKEAHTKLIAKNIPDATFIIFDGTGHNALTEIPQRFSETVLNFLEKR
ncbi:hypothetical protein DN752_13875 [Echinicola strongylocentroti]|uniref:AB hydrolase-1 domain-containing protein n=1 Tax=Echinicola strongylocentroti TaxID=1795355 RepID=A0A2Z4IK52_9BACT|nr:alpha/beta hydrolase [Echinicola strongylocentroti]AWW31127.1 hypothetical protein DN752_13875 [Echinicola strongylocentroti]